MDQHSLEGSKMVLGYDRVQYHVVLRSTSIPPKRKRRYGMTEWRNDGRTDGRTDRSTYRASFGFRVQVYYELWLKLCAAFGLFKACNLVWLSRFTHMVKSARIYVHVHVSAIIQYKHLPVGSQKELTKAIVRIFNFSQCMFLRCSTPPIWTINSYRRSADYFIDWM